MFTRRGIMANYVSNLRPTNAPIFAFAPTLDVCRQLMLSWGTFPQLLPFDSDPNRTIDAAIKSLIARSLIQAGDHLVIISDLISGDKRFDSIQLRVVD